MNSKTTANTDAGDFSKGKVSAIILRQAIPLTIAQLVQLLYNVVDRIYIGHIPGTGSLALTGVGVCFPIITMIAAFTALFGTGGTPLFSMARGAGDNDRANRVLSASAFLLLACAGAAMALFYILARPLLYAFGASDESYVYAAPYLRIYLLGTAFSMLQTGLNGYITAQGFPVKGMLTTLIGAILNLILDPVFIFVFGMGVAGAAIATVISQAAAALWVLHFLLKGAAPHKIQRKYFHFDPAISKQISALGASGFIMQVTNAIVQIVCNATLQTWGGDLYVGIMTVLNSTREILSLAVSGISAGAQPVIGYNYGASEYDRVKASIRFMTILGLSYTALAWLVVLLFPGKLIALFTSDSEMLRDGQAALRMYFFGFVFMSLQFSGQSTFQSLGMAKRAIFFSLLRKVIIVVPLTLILPNFGLGVNGVFIAEPISNVLGGLASFLTMYFTVYRRIGGSKKE